MDSSELLPHLFRTEYRKIIAVLCKRFGLAQIGIAEDIASETFLTAAQAWGVEGIPQNPTAWLYTVAKNKAANQLKRNWIFETKISPELSDHIEVTTEIDLSPAHIEDSQLQVMFALCHPSIPSESQVGLCLRLLCGFGIDEIASAFLTSKETINKRLLRAKEKLREEAVVIELPPLHEMDGRLSSVLTCIYLLFNEGYYSGSKDSTLRKDLCLEAIRLCISLVENKKTNTAEVNALLALMCFHTSRFNARFTLEGQAIIYDEQDISLWNSEWISKGGYFLNQSASDGKVSRYHLEAGIAYWATHRKDTAEKWQSMLQLYEQLLEISYSPLACLNMIYVYSRIYGKEKAIVKAEQLALDTKFYFMLLGELYTDVDDQKAIAHFNSAIARAKTIAERSSIERKIDKLAQKSGSSSGQCNAINTL